MILLASYSYILICSGRQSYTLTLDQLKLCNGSSVEGYYKSKEARIAKFNRSTYVWNFDIEYFTDFDETFTMQADFYHSVFNNNQYTKSPFRIPKMNFCDFWKKYYVDKVMEELNGKSNFPLYKPNDPTCPLKKVS